MPCQRAIIAAASPSYHGDTMIERDRGPQEAPEEAVREALSEAFTKRQVLILRGIPPESG